MQHPTPIAPAYGPADIDLHADGLLRCMAGNPAAGCWMPFTRFDPDAAMIEAGCILSAWRRYVASCIRRLESRGLATVRRSNAGMQVCSTPAGITHARLSNCL